MKIQFITDIVQVEGVLNDSPTAQAISRVLPLEATVSTWGEEIYFTIPVKAGLDATAQEVVAYGDIGYWPKGSALCLFFGPTPISRPGEIRPASAVNVVGRLSGDIELLKEVADGITIRIEPAAS
ncbi:MAG: hypothetical protein FJ135_08480 [Deltaproteobacteria bacterium]|nr:hypothetical protein [Deltaproteobacteria bacterium]